MEMGVVFNMKFLNIEVIIALHQQKVIFLSNVLII